MKKLYLGIKGHILCIDGKTGREQWRTKLRSSTITNVVFDGDSLHAYSNGHLFALNPNTGDILWENSLDGLGYGFCIIVTEGSSSYIQSASAIQAQQAAAAAATSAAAASSTSASS
jgi:outer membrane protein assembly factor BamB